MKIKIDGLEGLPEAARQFIKAMTPGRVYAFHGTMGAGKTTFISEVVRQLGSNDEPNSPTFSIVNIYDTREWGRVYHLDCYRIDDDEEALDMGIEDYFDIGNTAFVEWPDRVENFLPDDTIAVSITADDNGERSLTIEDPMA